MIATLRTTHVLTHKDAKPNLNVSERDHDGMVQCESIISGVLVLAQMFQNRKAEALGKTPTARLQLSKAQRTAILAHAAPKRPLKDRLDVPSDEPTMVEFTLVELLKLTIALGPAVTVSVGHEAKELKTLMRKLDNGLARLLGEPTVANTSTKPRDARMPLSSAERPENDAAAATVKRPEWAAGARHTAAKSHPRRADRRRQPVMPHIA